MLSVLPHSRLTSRYNVRAYTLYLCPGLASFPGSLLKNKGESLGLRLAQVVGGYQLLIGIGHTRYLHLCCYYDSSEVFHTKLSTLYYKYSIHLLFLL